MGGKGEGEAGRLVGWAFEGKGRSSVVPKRKKQKAPRREILADISRLRKNIGGCDGAYMRGLRG